VLTADVGELGISAHTDVVAPGASTASSASRCSSMSATTASSGVGSRAGLRPGGELFVHVFAHRSQPYLFEVGGAGDWMARNFFTGGMMPSEDWIPRAIDALEHRQTWRFDGRHYTRTLAAWRERLEQDRRRRSQVLGSGVTVRRRNAAGTAGARSSSRARNCSLRAAGASGASSTTA
jgi:hypothetical protein